MSLTKEQKESVVDRFRCSKSDTGSSGVQVALMTERISQIAAHLEQHKKDLHSRLGLTKLLSARRKHLNYLKRTNEGHYRSVLQRLGLRK